MTAQAATRWVAAVAFAGGLGGGLVFPILPALGLQLGISGLLIGLILSANRISRLLCDAPVGHLVDRIGGKRTLSWGMSLEALGIMGYSAALHFGHPIWWLLGGRIVFGIGSALLIVGAQATVLRLSSHANRGRRAATVRVALSMGMPGGLVLGGVIADVASDDMAFWVGACLTLVGALIAHWRVPTARPHTRRTTPAKISVAQRLHELFTLPGFPVLSLVWGFNTLIYLCVQGVLLATLVVLVHDRSVSLLGLRAQGTAGLVMAALMVSSSVMAFLLGRGIDRFRLRSSVVLPCLLVLAAGFAVLAFAATLGMMFLGALLVGGSFNGIILPMLTLLGDVIPPDQYGRAVGLYQVFGDVGGSVGPIVGLEAGIRLGLLPTYLGVAVLIAAALPAALWVRRREVKMRGGVG
ncbi:MAG TPA: MFS transporter [Nitrococcus sp.]|nr:MFS transporter [Nitrococcus sp.]